MKTLRLYGFARGTADYLTLNASDQIDTLVADLAGEAITRLPALVRSVAIRAAGVFLRDIVFNSRTSAEVHARRFFDLLTIKTSIETDATRHMSANWSAQPARSA
jgi:hypothetical protein